MAKAKVVKKAVKPRVLHVIARMNVGGTAVYLSNLVTGLTELGVENLLVIGNVPKGEVEDGVVATLPIARIGAMSRSLNFGNDRAAKKELDVIIKSFKPDLIHSHTFKAGLLVRLGKKSVPVVFVLVMCISVIIYFRGVYSPYGSDFQRDRSNEPLAWNCGLKADL